MFRKMAITTALGVALAGMVIISYTLASSGALEGFNHKYNIFNMVDENLQGMQEMGGLMEEVKTNVEALNEKLELVGRTNELLHQQLNVVEELNGVMSGQKPLLEESNASLSNLEGKLHMTLNLVRRLKPISSSLLAVMQDSVSLTEGVANGSSDMVSLASIINALFNETLGYLARIQPKSAKAHKYMQGGNIMSRLSEFLPPDRSVGSTSSASPPKAQTPTHVPANTLPNPEILRVIEQVSGNPVTGLLEGIRKLMSGQ